MGLCRDCMLIPSADTAFVPEKRHSSDRIIALGGNPNVGKSTIFNELTGLRQHTGNWPGKTVTHARGYCVYNQTGYVIVDLPGCYSLAAHTAEEAAARDFICFGGADAVVIVCDATCLERNMNLVLQALEITPHVVVCVNLMDEAQKKGIQIDLAAIAGKLGVPVIGTCARSKKGLDNLMAAISQTVQDCPKPRANTVYPDYIENAVSLLEPYVKQSFGAQVNSRWLSLALIGGHPDLPDSPDPITRHCFVPDLGITRTLATIRDTLTGQGIDEKRLKDDLASSTVRAAERLCADTVCFDPGHHPYHHSKIDGFLTGKWTAFPIMFLALLVIFWLTITGANYPSRLLSHFLFRVEDALLIFVSVCPIPSFVGEMLILGVYRVLAWVISVMLPPMAIFFPLFTLLEDVGFLPRVAFNLDRCFQKCSACGKQALTMCVRNLCCRRMVPPA